MWGMFWIALELSIPKIGLNILLSLKVKKLDGFKFDGVAESDNNGHVKDAFQIKATHSTSCSPPLKNIYSTLNTSYRVLFTLHTLLRFK